MISKTKDEGIAKLAGICKVTFGLMPRGRQYGRRMAVASPYLDISQWMSAITRNFVKKILYPG